MKGTMLALDSKGGETIKSLADEENMWLKKVARRGSKENHRDENTHFTIFQTQEK